MVPNVMPQMDENVALNELETRVSYLSSTICKEREFKRRKDVSWKYSFLHYIASAKGSKKWNIMNTMRHREIIVPAYGYTGIMLQRLKNAGVRGSMG